MKRNYILFLIIITLIHSCAKPKQQELLKYDLIFENSFAIELDSLTKRNHEISYFNENEENLYVYNDLIHSIYQFDIRNQTQSLVIPLKKEGPNEVNKVEAIIKAPEAEMFYLITNIGNLVKIDSTGKVISKEQFLVRDNGDASLTHRPRFFINNDKIYVSVRPNNTTDKEFSFLAFSGINYSKTEYVFPHPKNSNIGNYANLMNEAKLVYVDSKNTFVVSLPFSDHLFTYNLNENITDKFLAKSNLMLDPIKFKPNNNINYSSNYLMSNSWYLNLLYDRTNKIYYRLGSIGVDLSRGDPRKGEFYSNNENGYYHTLLMMDENFEKVGEIKGLNVPNYSFVNKGKLYVPNFEKEHDNEDVLIFDIYSIEEKVYETNSNF